MRTAFLFLGLLFFSVSGNTQTNVHDSVNVQHDRISRTGLLVLSGWAASNMVTGILLGEKAEGSARYFHRSNVLWGSVNLAISQTSLFLLRRKRGKMYNLSQTFKRTSTTEDVFLFNAGLDLAYVAYGLYRNERSRRFTGEKRERLHGAGKSLMLQGAFLALFDGVLYRLHRKNGQKLQPGSDHLGFVIQEGRLGMVVTF